jgi:hypothetical protein
VRWGTPEPECEEDEPPPPLGELVPRYRIVLPHHKMQDSWGEDVLHFTLPYDLARVTHLYLRHAYPVLNLGMEHNCLFVHPGTGDALRHSQDLQDLWQQTQAMHSAPWAHFPPVNFRHIHVNDQVQRLATHPGAHQLAGDARVMQNSVGVVWERNYSAHVGYYNHMVRGALDRITEWRHGQLREMLMARGGNDEHGSEDVHVGGGMWEDSEADDALDAVYAAGGWSAVLKEEEEEGLVGRVAAAADDQEVHTGRDGFCWEEDE